eukprot:8734778-Pyramimonas_sp.AAC.1
MGSGNAEGIDGDHTVPGTMLCCVALRCAAPRNEVPGDAPRTVPGDATHHPPPSRREHASNCQR